LKQGGTVSPLLFNIALDYTIRRVQVNQDSLKLNATHQLLVDVDDVNILEESLHTVKKNAEALVVAGTENGLEVNADKTKYMVMSRGMWPVASMGARSGVCRVFVGKHDGYRQLGRRRRSWVDNIKMHLQEVGWGLWTGLSWLRIGTGGGHL
jgi:hypothetical protein